MQNFEKFHQISGLRRKVKFCPAIEKLIPYHLLDHLKLNTPACLIVFHFFASNRFSRLKDLE